MFCFVLVFFFFLVCRKEKSFAKDAKVEAKSLSKANSAATSEIKAEKKALKVSGILNSWVRESQRISRAAILESSTDANISCGFVEKALRWEGIN